jgi:hypothetical protein
MHCFKNPIILALLGATLTYLYLMWENKNLPEEKKAKKISVYKPIIAGVIVMIISSVAFKDSKYKLEQIKLPIMNDLEFSDSPGFLLNFPSF